MGHAMQSVLMLTTRALAASDLEQSQLAAALQNVGPYFAVLTPFLFATVIGILIPLAGLWRAAFVPVWPFAVGVVAAAGFFLPVTDLVPTALISLALLWAGIGVLRSSPEAIVGPSAAPRFHPRDAGLTFLPRMRPAIAPVLAWSDTALSFVLGALGFALLFINARLGAPAELYWGAIAVLSSIYPLIGSLIISCGRLAATVSSSRRCGLQW